MRGALYLFRFTCRFTKDEVKMLAGWELGGKLGKEAESETERKNRPRKGHEFSLIRERRV
jgi:hypothetical protein